MAGEAGGSPGDAGRALSPGRGEGGTAPGSLPGLGTPGLCQDSAVSAQGEWGAVGTGGGGMDARTLSPCVLSWGTPLWPLGTLLGPLGTLLGLWGTPQGQCQPRVGDTPGWLSCPNHGRGDREGLQGTPTASLEDLGCRQPHSPGTAGMWGQTSGSEPHSCPEPPRCLVGTSGVVGSPRVCGITPNLWGHPDFVGSPGVCGITQSCGDTPNL